MKKLPKYFVIKRVENNPLWDKYIKWLGETYIYYWEGNVNAYYGYDGKEVTWNNDISSFSNNPTELTLEEWDEMVNGFTLPEKWCVKDCEEVSTYASNKWSCANFIELDKYYCENPETYWFFTKEEADEKHYIEITFEQFKQYVLKETNEMKKYSINDLKSNSKLIVFIESEEQFDKLVEYCGKFIPYYYGPYCYSIIRESYASDSTSTNVGAYDSDSIIVKFNEIDFMEKKIIGYRLTKKEMYKVASYILHGNSAGSGYLDDVMPVNRVDELREAGVLDLWFEPVYEEESFKAGDYVVVENSDNLQIGCRGCPEGVWKITSSEYTNGLSEKSMGFNVKTTSGIWRISDKGVRKATPEEIAKAKYPDITIKGYKAEFKDNYVKFGCQIYSKEFVLTLSECLEKNDFDMEIRSEIDAIAKYFISLD